VTWHVDLSQRAEDEMTAHAAPVPACLDRTTRCPRGRWRSGMGQVCACEGGPTMQNVQNHLQNSVISRRMRHDVSDPRAGRHDHRTREGTA
jgi:hypothetical protein